jgi:hypothetical protein
MQWNQVSQMLVSQNLRLVFVFAIVFFGVLATQLPTASTWIQTYIEAERRSEIFDQQIQNFWQAQDKANAACIANRLPVGAAVRVVVDDVSHEFDCRIG